MLFTVNPNTPRGGCVYKNKKTDDFYIRINNSKNHLDNHTYVRISDNYEYDIPERDMILWTILK